jgi:hypothetical protein
MRSPATRCFCSIGYVFGLAAEMIVGVALKQHDGS